MYLILRNRIARFIISWLNANKADKVRRSYGFKRRYNSALKTDFITL